jgi:threonine aldolase
MRQAPVGDDVYQEDPTVNKLEAEAAALVGKEAALFVSSGTMGNLLALMSHTQPGEEVILEADSHIYCYEVGGISRIAGLIPRPITGLGGIFTSKQLKQALRPENIHYPRTTLLCLENTHNRSGGQVLPQDQVVEVAEAARNAGLKLHLDGARIFNAAVASNTPVQILTAPFDSVMFCLSKGLAAPVGSILAGSTNFIARARKFRKMLGGGMRQAGILAAAGLESLDVMTKRLAEDHRRAERLAEGLSAVPGLKVANPVHTNIVMLDITCPELTAACLVSAWAEAGIITAANSKYGMRLVTHYQITDEDVEYVIEATRTIIQQMS